MSLIIENLNKTYGSKKVVNNISFKLEKPGIFGLLGTNGAGKTTTIRMILGILNKDSGTILWNDKEVSRKEVNFGYLPEERGLYPKSKIYDQIVYFAKLKGMKKELIDKEINYWFKRLEVEEYRNMLAEQLSKGNQQKIQFIISIIHNPDLIVLDEPFSGLDPVNTELLKSVVLELINKNKYIIMSSHQMNAIEEFCTDILILDHGKNVMHGNIESIKDTYDAKEVIVNTKEDIISILSDLKFDYNKINNTYSIQINKEKDAHKIINLLIENKVFINKFEIKKPSLHDIFVDKVKGGK